METTGLNQFVETPRSVVTRGLREESLPGRRGEKWTEAVDAASPKERRRASLTKSRGQGRRSRRVHAEEGR
jgi:hypothetical protein